MDRELCALFVGLATFVLGAPGSAHEGRSCVLETLDDPDGSLAVCAAQAPYCGTNPYGINDYGLVTGVYFDDAGITHGMLYLGGRFQTIDYPEQGSQGTNLYYANQYGLVAGNYYDAAGLSHSVVYDTNRRKWKELPDYPGAQYNAAGGVDAYGRVSGDYSVEPSGNNYLVAWVYDGRYHTFTAPGSDQMRLGTVTYGMSSDGTVVGFYLDSNTVYHGFTRAIGEQAKAFDVPGATSTFVLGINDRGALAGNYVIGGQEHGYVYQPGHDCRSGSVTNFDYPGAISTTVAGVNDWGDIVGTYTNQNNDTHGFIGHDCLGD